MPYSRAEIPVAVRRQRGEPEWAHAAVRRQLTADEGKSLADRRCQSPLQGGEPAVLDRLVSGSEPRRGSSWIPVGTDGTTPSIRSARSTCHRTYATNKIMRTSWKT